MSTGEGGCYNKLPYFLSSPVLAATPGTLSFVARDVCFARVPLPARVVPVPLPIVIFL